MVILLYFQHLGCFFGRLLPYLVLLVQQNRYGWGEHPISTGHTSLSSP